jgi:hypothetical protein
MLNQKQKERGQAPVFRGAIPAGKKRLSFIIAAIMLSLLAALFFFEVLLRIVYGRVENITGAARWEDSENSSDRYHPALGWALSPGYSSGSDGAGRITINFQGIRNRSEVPARPPEGVRRILVLGDSFVFGDEVGDDETVVSYLQRLPGVEAVNLGVHGYGVGQMVLWFEEISKAIRGHDVLLVVTLPSDPFRDPYPHYFRPKPMFSLAGGELRVENVPVPRGPEPGFILRHSFVAAFLFARAREVREPDRIDEVLATTVALIERLRETCRSQGARLEVILIGAPFWIRQKEPILFECEKVLASTLSEREIFVRDLVPWEVGVLRAEGDSLVRPKGHFGPRGNCLLAREIARSIGMGDVDCSGVPE